jgi:hypothetical protein
MGLLIVAAILAIPLGCLWLILRIRERRHPNGRYGGQYDDPGRMSVMTYAQMSAMTASHVPSGVGSDLQQAGEAFSETEVVDPGACERM